MNEQEAVAQQGPITESEKHNKALWGMYKDISQSREEIIKKAELVGCEAVFGDAHTIQLDLDSKQALDFFNNQFCWMQQQCDMTYDYKQNKSRNGNYHVTIKIQRELSVYERLLIQCLLGSDLKRELLNYTRYFLNGDDMSCLFKPKPLQLTGEVTHD